VKRVEPALPTFRGAETRLNDYEKQRIRRAEEAAEEFRRRIEAQARERQERFDAHRASVHAGLGEAVAAAGAELREIRDAMRSLARDELTLDAREANRAWAELDRRRARAQERIAGLRDSIDAYARMEDTPQEVEDEIRSRYPALRTRR
jgi:DNA repair exonuclease SbcCD ATPase subunit